MRRRVTVIIFALGLAGSLAALAFAARIDGTARPDVLRGTAAADKLYGKAGDDKLYGLGGNDVLVGGAGRDQVFCGAGKDTVQADRQDKVARDCEVVKRPPEPPPPEPPPQPSVVDFRVCPEAAATPTGGSFFCDVDYAGRTISASRVYCTARIANGSGKQAQIAFLRGGSIVVQTDPFAMTRDNLYTVYATVDAPQPGSWSCQAKVNGASLSELAFTVG